MKLLPSPLAAEASSAWIPELHLFDFVVQDVAPASAAASESPEWLMVVVPVVSVLMMLGMLAYIFCTHLPEHAEEDGDTKTLRHCKLLIDLGEFIAWLRAAVLIASSMAIVHNELGSSGALLGSFWASYFIGALGFKFVTGTVDKARVHFIVANAVFLASTIALGWVAVNKKHERGLRVLCVCQLLSGVAGGYLTVFRDLVRKKTYLPSQLTSAVSRRAFISSMSVALGLLFGAGCSSMAITGMTVHEDHLNLSKIDQDNITNVAGLLLSIPMLVVHLVSIVVYYPLDLVSLAHNVTVAQKLEEDVRSKSSSSLASMRWWALVILICMSACCSMIYAALEATTVAILHTDFDWNHIQAGAFVSISFLSYPGFELCFQRIRKTHADYNIARCALCLLAFASLLLTKELGPMIGTDWGPLLVILLSDAIAFPTVRISMGTFQGWILRYAMPDGVMTDANLTILRHVVSSSIARGLAPALSRSCLETHGRNAYAGMQLVLCITTVISMEFGVVPFLVADREQQMHPSI